MNGKKKRAGIKSTTNQSHKQKGGSIYREQANRTHRCGPIYSTIIDILLWPFKIFKKFLRAVGVTGYIESVAKENRDYVLLFHIIMFMVVLGLVYFIYRMIFGGSLSVDIAYISNFLSTMDSFDLPMSEEVNAKAEREALDSWICYFSNNPLSFQNSGLFDIVRSLVLLPFVAFFIFPVLPILLLIYTIWFVWHFWKYIAKAVVGIFTAAIKYMTEYIVCKVSGPIPFFSFKCPDIADTFVGWRKKHVDEPVYKERLKYLKVWYKHKWNYWDRVMLYLEKFWKKGRVQNGYNQKFFVRSKEVFYEKAVNLNDKIDQNGNQIFNKVKSKIPATLSSRIPTLPNKIPSLQDGQKYLESAGTSAVTAYHQRHLAYGVLSLLTLLAIVALLGSYALTGRPIGIYEFIGPLWRSTDLGNQLLLLSSRYNWLGIIAITLLLVYLIIPGPRP